MSTPLHQPQTTLSRLARAALTGGMFAYFGLGSFALSQVVLPFALRDERDERARVRGAHRIVARGFRQFHALARAAGLVDYEPSEALVAPPAGPCVYVANHPTLLDVTALSAALGAPCTIVRSDLFEHPLLGSLLRACWHIDAGDGAAMSGAAAIQGALERLAAGFSVLIFPEGSRSPEGGLRRLRRGAFEIACRANVPVVVLHVKPSEPMLSHERPWHAMPARPVKLSVEQLAVLRPGAFEHDAQRMARRAGELLRARMGAGTPRVSPEISQTTLSTP